MGGGCMGGGGLEGTGGKGVGKKIKKKIVNISRFYYYLIRDGFLILLFTYVNLYLLVLLFILSFIVSYGGNKGVDILYLKY